MKLVGAKHLFTQQMRVKRMCCNLMISGVLSVIVFPFSLQGFFQKIHRVLWSWVNKLFC